MQIIIPKPKGTSSGRWCSGQQSQTEDMKKNFIYKFFLLNDSSGMCQKEVFQKKIFHVFRFQTNKIQLDNYICACRTTWHWTDLFKVYWIVGCRVTEYPWLAVPSLSTCDQSWSLESCILDTLQGPGREIIMSDFQLKKTLETWHESAAGFRYLI